MRRVLETTPETFTPAELVLARSTSASSTCWRGQCPTTPPSPSSSARRAQTTRS